MIPSSLRTSGIWDNHHRGFIGDFLKEKVLQDSNLSFVSAYFTIYAYAALKDQLNQIRHLRFLFGEPQFIKSLDPEKSEKKTFRIEHDSLSLSNRLEQKREARECSEWLKSKVDIRSIVKPGFLHGKMYHMDNNGVQEAIIGSANFTVRGLGLGAAGNNIELNLEVDSTRDRKDLKKWFDEVWNDKELVEDVKDEVLHYLRQLYENHSPEFIYFKTLFHIFEDYLSEAERGGLLDERTGFFESNVWEMLYDFQKDSVRRHQQGFKRHGCIIADSVAWEKPLKPWPSSILRASQQSRTGSLPQEARGNWKVCRENDTRNPLLGDRFAFTVMAHPILGAMPVTPIIGAIMISWLLTSPTISATTPGARSRKTAHAGSRGTSF